VPVCSIATSRTLIFFAEIDSPMPNPIEPIFTLFSFRRLLPSHLVHSISNTLPNTLSKPQATKSGALNCVFPLRLRNGPNFPISSLHVRSTFLIVNSAWLVREGRGDARGNKRDRRGVNRQTRCNATTRREDSTASVARKRGPGGCQRKQAGPREERPRRQRSD
jgi:hypothetical protein